jgi:signal transduction histidine kinase
MANAESPKPPLIRSLSARLLLLTIAFVMLGEVMIYVPSIARYRVVYLQERIDAGRLAAFAVEASPDYMVGPELRERLLAQARVEAVVLHRPDRKTIMLSPDMPPRVDATFDLREAEPVGLIGSAFWALWHKGGRHIRVLAAGPETEPDMALEIVMSEGRMYLGMVDYSRRILTLSIVLSLMTAGLVFLSLHLLMVRPMRRITDSMVAFRDAPEDAANVITPSGRHDEIGVAQRELAVLQEGLRQALHQKTRLAALGTAVSKINHDLKNILSTALLVSDRIARIDEPEVKKATPTLMRVIERAVSLCGETLTFARAEEPRLRPTRFPLRPLVDDVAGELDLPAAGVVAWSNEVPADCALHADRDQLFRVLLNLGRNAMEAVARSERPEKRVTISARPMEKAVIIEVADTGSGIPERARAHLFEPFAGVGREGGTGLGLAIASDLVRAHGGAIELTRTGADGSLFRITLPTGA